MKIYHTATQEDYDALMTELEGKERKWIGGNEPTFFKFWKTFKESTCIRISDKGVTFGNIEQYKKQYPDTLIIEYKAKGDNMKIYHVETQEDYDALMVELEEKGITWSGGSKPTSINNWQRTGLNTCISLNNRVIEYCDTSYYTHNYPYIEIFKYKAKGDNMVEKQFKQQSLDLAANIATALGNIGFGLNLKDEELTEMQKLVKKFDETLTEFIDSRKPKFKVGEYIVNKDGSAKWIGEIIEVDGKRTMCNWYDVSMNKIRTNIYLWDENSIHATPEEISEYKTALNFHKHGRKPFEVKEGDLVKIPSGGKQIVAYAEVLTKPDFANGWELIKTEKEVWEWLGE